jgi:membrane protease YdiL (CAAX protease family)
VNSAHGARTPLDVSVAAIRKRRPDPVLSPAVTLAVVVITGAAVAAALPGVPLAARLPLVLAALWIPTIALARRAARVGGGARQALGLERPRPEHLKQALVWFPAAVAAQIVAAFVLTTATPWPDGNPGNVGQIDTGQELLRVVVLAVLSAPIIEELLFRGLLLRGLMTRMPFWPAALVSSTVFGLAHAPGATGGSVVVVVTAAVLGVVLCMLARATGSLIPGMILHTLRNAVALASAVVLT